MKDISCQKVTNYYKKENLKNVRSKCQKLRKFSLSGKGLMSTRVARHASKKTSTSVKVSSNLYTYSNFSEADFDQPTNYSLRYAEENSVIEEVGHFENLIGDSEQENIVVTYNTEGTPFETPVHISKSTSTSDLVKLDDLKVNNSIDLNLKDCIYNNQVAVEDKLERSKIINQFKSYMEFENKDKECENTDLELYLPDDLDDFDEKCNDERSERIINVTPSHSPVELYEKDKDGKLVVFGGDRYSQQTPLMFSRCSSLGSLSGYEQSLHDDRSSIVSDFSRRTSEAVSPSELPDSPAQLIPSGTSQQRDRKLGRKKIQQSRDKIQSSESFSVQQEVPKRSIFEDDLSVFKEESTPVKFQSVAASSLSSLTIDDEDDEHEHGETKAGVIRTFKTSANDQLVGVDMDEKKTVNSVNKYEENTYFSVDEEQILDEYIRKGIAKVTRQHINDVSSFNLQVGNAYDSSDNDPDKLCESACKSNCSMELFDENSDLTAEEEKLLDECIRRGIAKVTRQNINDVTSLSLRTNFSGLSLNCDKSEKQENQQQKSEESQNETVCQKEL